MISLRVSVPERGAMTVGNSPSRSQELKVDEIRAGLEVPAFCQPDSLQLVVDGAPPEMG